MILDILLIALVGICIYIGYNRGIVKALYGLITIILAGVASCFLSSLSAEWVYNSFFADAVRESINAVVLNTTSSVEATAQQAFDSLPENVLSILSFFGVKNVDNFSLVFSTDTLQSQLENSIMSAVTRIFGFIFIILFFILIVVIMKVAEKSILRIFDFPVIKQINSVLGMVLGILQGLILCFLGVFVFRILFNTEGQNVVGIDLINNSLIFNRIYYSEFVIYISEFFS